MPLTTLLPSPASRAGEIVGLLGFGRARDRAGQHDAVGEAFDGDVGVRQRALERRANAIEIARHRDVEGHQLLAFGVEEIDVGLSDLDADDVGAPRGANDRVGDLGIGHQHVLDVAGQVDDDALAHAERDELRCLVAVDLDGGSDDLRPRGRRR